MTRRRAIPRLAVILACFWLSACEQELYHGLTERDANEMYAVLAEAGIASSRVAGAGGAYDVKVAPESMAAAIRALDKAGLPRANFFSLAEVFPPRGLIESAVEQRARYQFALSQEIERTLAGLAGVAAARAHVSLGEKDLRGLQTVAPGASVAVRYRPGADLAELSAQIKSIVSGAVDGAQAERVFVVFTPEASGADEAGLIAGAVAPLGARVADNCRPGRCARP